MGTDVHIQRMPEAERLEQARDQAAEDSPELALAAEVEHLRERVTAVEQAVSGESTLNTVGKAITQGAVGAVGGLVGAVCGTILSPGQGTIGGAVVGQEVAKGVAGDVTKTLTARAYDRGTEAITNFSGGFSSYVENLINEKLRKRFGDDAQTGSGNTDYK